MSIFKNTKNTRAILPNSFRYIRSDVPTFLSDDERQWLIDRNVRTVVDLREMVEQHQKPCFFKNDSAFHYVSFPVTGGGAIPASADEVAFSYINMVDGAMENIIRVIMNAGTNVMYFCNFGKDRTGVVTAIILSKLGYSKQYIIDDYLLSGKNLKDEINEFTRTNPDIDINIITPKAKYMEKFLEWYLENL